MKKLFSIILVGLLIGAVSPLVFAEQPQGSMMGGKGMTKEGKMMGMYSMSGMMKMMMGRTMVATKDGGVIVMVGNRLLKYDGELNLQKEVELKIDMKGMQKMMQMEEECPMGGKMMQEGSMMGGSREKSEESAE